MTACSGGNGMRIGAGMVAAAALALGGCAGTGTDFDGANIFGSSATELQVTSEPAGAQARVSSGESCAATPCAIKVAAGAEQYVVTVSKPGFLDQSVEVGWVASGGGDSTYESQPQLAPNPVSVTLEPAPPAKKKKKSRGQRALIAKHSPEHSRSPRHQAARNASGRRRVLLGAQPDFTFGERAACGLACLKAFRHSPPRCGRRERAARRRRRPPGETRMNSPTPARPRVGLFVTCLVDLIRPSVGFAAVKLLEDAGCTVEVPRPDLLRPAGLQFRRPRHRARSGRAGDRRLRGLRLCRGAVRLLRAA